MLTNIFTQAAVLQIYNSTGLFVCVTILPHLACLRTELLGKGGYALNSPLQWTLCSYSKYFKISIKPMFWFGSHSAVGETTAWRRLWAHGTLPAFFIFYFCKVPCMHALPAEHVRGKQRPADWRALGSSLPIKNKSLTSTGLGWCEEEASNWTPTPVKIMKCSFIRGVGNDVYEKPTAFRGDCFQYILYFSWQGPLVQNCNAAV